MKKLIVLVLVVACVIGLAGCSANDTGIIKWTSAISVEDIGAVQLVEFYENRFSLPKRSIVSL